MNTVSSTARILAIAALLSFAAGCGNRSGGSTQGGSAGSPAHADDHQGHDHHPGDGRDHGHAAAPHGGHLVELGRNHQYHVEWVDHDGSGNITLYVLDADMKELPVAKDAIVVNLAIAGKPLAVELTTTNEADGKASAFTVGDTALAQRLREAEKVAGKVTVTFDGTPYVGVVEVGAHEHGEHEHGEHGHDAHDDESHDHDHQGHDHEGHDHQ